MLSILETMIGFLKPEKMELVMKDYQYYKLHYCSICRHLVRNNSRLYSFLTGYEGTLLAMLYNEMVAQDTNFVKDRCSGVPLFKVAVLPASSEAIELGAFICLLAFQIKFQDNLMDESGFWITRYNKFFKNHIQKSFAKKKDHYSKFNIDLNYVQAQQRELNRLENDESIRDMDVYLDFWGDTFSYIMTQPFKDKISDARLVHLKFFFAELGKIINLLDAMADLHQDKRNQHFNLLLRAEKPALFDDDDSLKILYQKYSLRIKEIQASLLSTLPQLELRESWAIVQNILTHCLDNEMRKVFESMVLRKEVPEKLLFNCKDF